MLLIFSAANSFADSPLGSNPIGLFPFKKEKENKPRMPTHTLRTKANLSNIR